MLEEEALSALPLITLTTDFGDQDGFVGAMKGVILSINPEARIVDISHAVPRQDVRAGAMVLRGACPYFPEGTVHVAVIDPGVGSSRAAVVVETALAFYVLPDNGLITLIDQITPVRHVYAIEQAGLCLPDVSRTFHGRDIFAPVAAHLSRGLPPNQVGPPMQSFAELDVPAAVVDDHRVEGHVLYVDVFGNCITNIGPEQVNFGAFDWRWRSGDREVAGLKTSYAEATWGEALMIQSSNGCLELAVNGGNAAEMFGLKVGDLLVLYR
ncbi:SAM hydrolase/SAM-dependent halogenase family protein [Acanthopleuribacter pedis]|uniref:SAM-dependent chlorinase/fluorinase n=1 Tax=Acanthopleuribacter pedis TaxID=442870 RepID=A0A8J7U6K9_9BACT|nr:SAM-dependent chlorinase/fluorinase [Acanthopleuribacter pedis]MBO1322034.1 SAM-dependent chlorinase/fluorinase [Acanthopleuribacter pedis]